MRVLVCDDDGQRAKDWCLEVKDVLEGTDAVVEHLEPAELAKALAELISRQRLSRASESSSSIDLDHRIDAADVLIVDHDLTPAEPDASTDGLQGRSGEGFAMLARCFSSVGYIVLVNKSVQTSTFDLTMTRFSDSYADLNVTDQDLDRRELWWGVADSGATRFRPSHWPLLAQGADGVKSVVETLELDAGVLATLGLESVVQDFAREQLDILGDDPLSATFRDVAVRPGVGLSAKDSQPDARVLRKIAAFGIRRWLTSVVLPGQNVLVDLCHLLERSPELQANSTADLTTLSPADLRSFEVVCGAVPGLQLLKDYQSPASRWVDQPLWVWSELDLSVLSAERLPADEDLLVVCEDTSTLARISDAREFEAAVPGPYLQRFARLAGAADGVAYGPRNRLMR